MTVPRILLADESEIFLEMVRGFLKDLNATVLCARSGDEAVKTARRVLPHVAIISQELPGITGTGCCEAFRQHPALARVMVVLVMAKHSHDAAGSCRAAGAAEVLAKPLNKRLFLATMGRLLEEIETREWRVPCRATVAFAAGRMNQYGTLEDIGENGMYVGSRDRIPPGETVTMSFLLPGRQSLIRCSGRVAWENRGSRRKKRDLPEGFGVEFLEVTEADKELICEFIEYSEVRHGMSRERIPTQKIDGISDRGASRASGNVGEGEG